MKQNKVVFLIFLALLTGTSAQAKNTLGETKNSEVLKIIADYLSSMDQVSRTRLASKLYYLDPSLKKLEAQSTLFDELKKSGRVSNENNLSRSPRTTACESLGNL